MRFLVPILLVIAATALSEEVVREESVTASLQEGAPLSVENINGDITVTGADIASAELSFRAVAESQEELDALDIIIDTTDGLVCRVEFDSGEEDLDCGRVDFQIRVPRDVLLDYAIGSVNGNVAVSNAAGEAELATVNGNVEVDRFSGTMEVEVVNGDITVEDSPGTSGVAAVNGSIYLAVEELLNDLEIETVNGSIEVKLDAQTQVAVETLSGEIEVDGFDATIIEDLVGRSTSFGEGETALTIATVNGHVKITD